MLTIEKLREYGASVDMGLSRCANNEGLYLRLVGICIGELSSDKLKEALLSNDLDGAFEIAHKLKGGVTNLALDPIGEPLCELTEKLRDRVADGCMDLYEKIAKETERLKNLAE